MKLRRALLEWLIAVPGGLLLARLLYATDWGHAALRLVPPRLWSGLFDILGVQGAEATSSVEVGLVLLVCVIVAALLVRAVATVIRRNDSE